MAVCRAACLRPFVSLREFRGPTLCRQPARRLLPCRAVAAAAAAAGPAASGAPKFAALPAEQQQQVEAFLDILLDWNTHMNLTAVKDRGEAYERHVNDSLALLPALDRCLAEQQAARQAAREQLHGSVVEQWGRADAAGSRPQPEAGAGAGAGTLASAEAAAAAAPRAPAAPRVIDVGSGAGLPGIILAIARPEWEVTLLDSLQKRCRFNEEAVKAAGLTNVRVHCARAEDAGQEAGLRKRHDVAIARAVAELRVLAELCLPLVRVGGHWVAAKGPAPHEEVAAAGGALTKLGGKLLAVAEVDSEGPEGRRTAVVVLKAKATPAAYPRKPGVPGKKPL